MDEYEKQDMKITAIVLTLTVLFAYPMLWAAENAFQAFYELFSRL